ncbi:gamma-glutamyl-gamma-aminobutyrate hydrolase family protein [Ectothiorhodosinus mongolicus]|nr:gamma-glutamyl-gamma-aminobutyrate hydrolase family protein [Ectothiorhodosinus mongolicus]
MIEPVHGEARDAVSEDWYRYLHVISPEIVLLPLLNAPDRVARWASDLEIDAAILSNGNDWGECTARDETERALVDWCRTCGRPVLGVCRGLQVLNALRGGTVETDIASVSGQDHGGTRHDVTLCSPQFVELAGREHIVVNSYHDQGVTISGLGPGLVPFALSDGDVVEGFYHPVEAILGIQWHPERPGAPYDFDMALIGAFLKRGAFWSQPELER